MATLENLEHLQINRTSITGEGLAVFKELPKLRRLLLHDMKLGKTGIKNLASVKSLERLDFSYLDIRDVDLAYLSVLSRLKYLSITFGKSSPSQITNDGLIHLSKITTLEYLLISGKNINDNGLKHLAKLKSLKTLRFNKCPITDRGLHHLETLTSLKELIVDYGNITEKGMAMIEAKIPGLQCMARDYDDKPGRTRIRTSKGIIN